MTSKRLCGCSVGLVGQCLQRCGLERRWERHGVEANHVRCAVVDRRLDSVAHAGELDGGTVDSGSDRETVAVDGERRVGGLGELAGDEIGSGCPGLVVVDHEGPVDCGVAEERSDPRKGPEDGGPGLPGSEGILDQLVCVCVYADRSEVRGDLDGSDDQRRRLAGQLGVEIGGHGANIALVEPADGDAVHRDVPRHEVAAGQGTDAPRHVEEYEESGDNPACKQGFPPLVRHQLSLPRAIVVATAGCDTVSASVRGDKSLSPSVQTTPCAKIERFVEQNRKCSEGRV